MYMSLQDNSKALEVYTVPERILQYLAGHRARVGVVTQQHLYVHNKRRFLLRVEHHCLCGRNADHVMAGRVLDRDPDASRQVEVDG